ncbi:MAG: hypothetical protein KAH17_07635 [Bacteroidales bacterium]|nr:hypothetical protein [Bacteroidales bacterium]
MKRNRLSLLGLIAIGFAVLFNACEPEVIVVPPLVTVNPAEEDTVAPGEVVLYEIIVSSDTDLNSLIVEASTDGTIFATADTIFPASAQSAIINFPLTVPEDFEDGTIISISFKAENQGESTVVFRSVYVQKLAGAINSYTAIIMADLENPNGSSFFSLDNNELMTLGVARDNSEKVDLIYYYGNTNKATLCSPTDEDVKVFTDSHDFSIVDQLATKNATELAAIEMTNDDFDAISDDGPITASTPEESVTAVNQLAVGQVMYAKTVTGKQALIMVKDITGGQGTSEITIDVKIQL